MHGFCCPVKGAPHPLTPHSHGKRVGDTALTGKVSHDGGRGGCGSRSGRRSGRVGVAGDGPVSEPGERGTDGSGRRHHHRPRSALSAAVWPLPSTPSLRAGAACAGPSCARTDEDQAWSHGAVVPGPGVVPRRGGPRTRRGPHPKIKGWDHGGPTGPISRVKRGTSVGPRLWF